MYPKYDIHVCLISGQAAPSLLPILDDGFKPKSAIFFVSKKMKNNAESLEKVFKEKGVKVISKQIHDETNFVEMEDLFIDTVSEYEAENIALNVTGGTKLMAIAAQNSFAMAGKPIFYIDSDKNQILFITRDSNKNLIQNKNLSCQVDIKTYLNAYGMTFKQDSKPCNPELIAEIDCFIKQYDEYQKNIPLLNLYAANSQHNVFKIKLEDKDKKINSFHSLLEELHYKDIIDFVDNQIDFRNRKQKDFLNGIWLEEYTYQQIKDIKQIQDIALSLEVGNTSYNQNKNQYDSQNQGNQNEFDIAFMAKNKLHIIECKTQKLDKGNGIKAEDILYKLETLKDYGGLMTKKCLVSYFEVPESVLNRAKELRIEIIQGKDLQRLKSKIQDWIGKN